MTNQGIYSIEDIKVRCTVDKSTKCWHWKLAVARDGRPIVNVILPTGKRCAYNGRRASLVMSGNMGRPGMMAGPTLNCRSHDCMNPAHSRYYTRSNLQRMYSERGIYQTAAFRSAAKITAQSRSSINRAIAQQIRQATGTIQQVADRFGVSWSVAQSIRAGTSWLDTAANTSVFTWRPAA